VRGNATLALAELEEGRLTPARLEEIDLAASRAAELTNQLLMYSGKGRLQRELTDLNELIAEVETLLGAAVSKETRLRYELASEPLYVLGDRSQIQQVAMNLITNASEAMGARGGTVTVRTRVEEAGPQPAGRDCVLVVEDEGPGMDEDTQSRILEPFFSTKFTGRGLGLATVSGIVRRHHGSLSVDSDPSRGSRFEVRFPAAEEPDLRSEPARAERSEWQGAGTILVVDDEAAVRRLLTAHLNHLGFAVTSARDGLEALARFRQHHDELAVVLMDQTMPEMEGVDAAREVQRLGGEVPVVILSGYGKENVVSEELASGVAGFIQKPFSLEDLRRTLEGLLPPQGRQA